MSDWHKQRMNIAFAHAQMSPDPSTKVGAVIVDKGRIVSWGHNRIPQLIPYLKEQLEDREWKYARIIHAEHDALMNICGQHMEYPMMYVTHYPCERCAAAMIHAGIQEVWTHKVAPEMVLRWPGMKIAAEMFLEAKIPVNFIEQ